MLALPTPYYDDGRGIVIYNADCRDILPLLELGSVDLVLTDPPYGVNIGHHHGAAECRAGLLVKAAGYEDTPERFTEVIVPALRMALAVARRGMVFCVPPSMWLLPAPDAIGGVFVPAAVGRNRWGWSNMIHCLLYGTAPHMEDGAKATAIRSAATAENTGHPVTKPLTWIRWAVALGSMPGEMIIDPFMGSGTTLRAAKDLGRRCIGIEISEEYCEIAARRLAQEVLAL